MKLLLIPLLSGISMFPVTDRFIDTEKPEAVVHEMPCPGTVIENIGISLQQPGQDGKMSAIAFKSQDYCRAEPIENFEFEVQFKVVSAKVYFSGANFRNVETGEINSNSLKPVKKLMDRCIPGTVVTFDDVKVIGPDKKIRTIRGLSLLLN